ncbi:hypothetical protein [Sulfitobacter sabulilitoris]|uniref:Uncharacterized protein n=1 Tax=Sulfitobacter sabulilitoris TaxID=2562655 RepID=A0A5S3PR38_9RHOB|nr:hypothetical protein [Sulfitobacter sabulilitoris]TMM55015.1 hypothetical protein FDT80_05430 [Sulfitobacter sabulilitoris]
MATVLIAVLALWMLVVGVCGYAASVRGFVIALLAGLTANTVWLMVGLGASPVNPSFVIAQLAACLYAVCAFASGWLIGRMVQQFRAGRVE